MLGQLGVEEGEHVHQDEVLVAGAEGLVTAVTLENAADTVVEAGRRLLEQRVQQVDRVEDVGSRLEHLSRKQVFINIKFLSYIHNQMVTAAFTNKPSGYNYGYLNVYYLCMYVGMFVHAKGPYKW